MDLGVSSPQIDNPVRGFSFRFDGPLDMRMDTTRGESVADWLATAELQQIAEVIRDYGEERFAVQIAKAIDARRQERGPISTTAELAELVAGTVKTREQGQNPATRTFQALRIFINAELEELQQALDASLAVLQPGGRLAVIAFHSLEDRIVKKFFSDRAGKASGSRHLPVAHERAATFAVIGKSMVSASEAEAEINPRARSAKLRAGLRTNAAAEAADMSLFGFPNLASLGKLGG
jgi:16S rRNA (cytosine1402-N4)-methyltransferase